MRLIYLPLLTMIILAIPVFPSCSNTPADPNDALDGTVPNDVALPGDISIGDETGDTLPPTADTEIGEEVFTGVDITTEEDATTPIPEGTCSLPPAPVNPSGIQLELAFPNLTFTKPLFLTTAGDGTNRLFVVEQTGRIRVFPAIEEVALAKIFLDLSFIVTKTSGEGGLLGLAFHPDYANNGYFFVNYTAGVNNSFRSVIARFKVSEGDPDLVDPDTELIILNQEQPFSNHNGGMIAFGPDGMLYIGLGDGGSGGDPLNMGQNNGTLLGAIMRIDVNASSETQPYVIPADNPFVGEPGARGEIFAIGLRNPWRFSFDSVTGALWAGDVGQNAYEEIDIIIPGRNYGWRIKEGFHCFNATFCDESGLTDPVLEYPQPLGLSVTGGYVYRGTKLPDLYGAYVFADYVTRAIFTYKHGEEPPPTEPTFYAPSLVSSFGVDAQGELYITGYDTGRIYRFEPALGPGTPEEPFPQTLTETGCFADIPSMLPFNGLHPYSPIAPFWSDGASKERYVVLPEGESFSLNADGTMEVPDGTLFIKNFSLETESGNPDSAKRIETRFLVKEGPGDVRGYTYQWNDEQTEATLLPTGASAPWPHPYGETETFGWQFPSQQQCQTCHTVAAGGVLGFTTAQLNHKVDGQNQITTLFETGLLSGPSPTPESLPSSVDPFDESQPLDLRARAYLGTNCANCHRSDGPTPSEMDLQPSTALVATKICNIPPEKGDLGITNAFLLAPGEPEKSVLLARMKSNAASGERMPPLSSSIVHEEGVALIEEWIDGLTQCE